MKTKTTTPETTKNKPRLPPPPHIFLPIFFFSFSKNLQHQKKDGKRSGYLLLLSSVLCFTNSPCRQRCFSSYFFFFLTPSQTPSPFFFTIYPFPPPSLSPAPHF